MLRRWFIACWVTVALAAAEVRVAVPGSLTDVPATEREASLLRHWQATPVELPAGHVTLAALVERLTGPRNATTLADPALATRTFDVPGFTGSYWEAVLQVCAWCDLDLIPGGERTPEDWWGRPDGGAILPMQSGPVVLALRDRTQPMALRVASGGLLLELAKLSLSRAQGAPSGQAELSLHLRSEPQVAPTLIDQARVVWRSISANGEELSVDASVADPERLGIITLSGAFIAVPFLELSGQVHLQLQETFTVAVDLGPNDTAIIDLGAGDEARLELLDRDVAKEQGRRSACTVLRFPGTVLSAPFAVTVTDHGETIATQGGTGRHDPDGESESVQYLVGLGGGLHHVELSGQRKLGEITLPLSAAFDLGTLTAETPAGAHPGCATVITWLAGRVSLQTALDRLRASGNEVLVDLGVATATEQDLPAFTGDFWQAVLMVATTWELALQPPAASTNVSEQRAPGTGEVAGVALNGGPLRLGRGGLPTGCQACGPVLVEVAAVRGQECLTLAGANRQVVVALRLRLEPRIAENEITGESVYWSTQARTDHGRDVTVAAGCVEPGALAGLWQLTADAVPLATEHLEISGQLAFQLLRPLQTQTTLAYGETTTAVLGNQPVTVMLGKIRDSSVPGVVVTYDRDTLELVGIQVSTSDGQSIASRGHNSRNNNRRVEEQWPMPGLQAEGRYTVALTSHQVAARLSMPIAVTVALPQP